MGGGGGGKFFFVKVEGDSKPGRDSKHKCVQRRQGGQGTIEGGMKMVPMLQMQDRMGDTAIRRGEKGNILRRTRGNIWGEEREKG